MTLNFLPRAAAFLLACLACAGALAQDPHSYANENEVRVRGLHLDLKADFDQRSLSGFAELTLNWVDQQARTIDLDTRDLAIARVHYQDARGGWINVPFRLDKAEPGKGQALHITLPQQAARMRIYYRTTPAGTALQWLAPAQTMSGKRPFMFSQSQQTHARSWVPLQDTPAVRFTYTARIDAPAGLRVVMGGENDTTANGAGGWRIAMPQPIPAYLLSIAIGELDQLPLGPRTTVYAEPLRLNAATFELADTEKMLAAAEALLGPYRWQRFDMVVLPPAFPRAGIANPRLAFLNATMVTGDRSQVGHVANALAHSWAGNLATNATWEHHWLGEGFAAYLANRIMEASYGIEVASMQRQLEQEETSAALGIDGEGIGDARGAWLLHSLEQRIGRAQFDVFMRAWFDKNAFRSVTTQQFVAALRSKYPQALTDGELDAWRHGPAVPASAVREASARLARLDAERARWLANDLPTERLADNAWSALEWMKFLNDIDGKASAAQLTGLDRVFGLATTSNHDIAFRYFRAVAKTGIAGVRAPLAAFLTGDGRHEVVVPLYALLLEQPQEKGWVRALYLKARPLYHPQLQVALDKLMKATP